MVSSSPTTSSTNSNDWSNLFYAGAASLAALHLVAMPFVAPAFRKYTLPYVAANKIQLNLLTNSLKRNGVGRIVDLGSGDGVVCIHVAKQLSIPAVGYELNPWLVWWSKFNAHVHGVGHLCTFHRKDLFKASLQTYDGIVLFVVPSMMSALEVKLAKEMDTNSKVYAVRFPLDTWKEEEYESGKKTGGYNVNQLWVYSKPSTEK